MTQRRLIGALYLCQIPPHSIGALTSPKRQPVGTGRLWPGAFGLIPGYGDQGYVGSGLETALVLYQ